MKIPSMFGVIMILNISHLQSFHREFLTYFPDTERDNLAFIDYPYMNADNDINMFNCDNDNQEEFLILSIDSTAQDAFKDENLN